MFKRKSPGARCATEAFVSVCLAADSAEHTPTRLPRLVPHSEIGGRLKLCKRRVVVWVGAA